MLSSNHVPINSKVKQSAGLENHVMKPNEASPNGTNKFILTEQTEYQKTREMTLYAVPSVGLDVSDDEVKRRTGFLVCRVYCCIFLLCVMVMLL